MINNNDYPYLITNLAILVNAENPLREENQFVLTQVKNNSDIYLDIAASAALNNIMEKIDGWKYIVPVSGYRSYDEQLSIYQESISDNGLEFTKKYVALAGCSEHQTGLAIDLALLSDNIDFIRPDFPNEGICQEFRELSNEYGFIERYRKDKEHITHISYEPWHFRYVGFPHSVIIAKLNLSLEEYHELIRNHEYPNITFKYRWKSYEFKVAYLTNLCLLESKDFSKPNSLISNDNRGGFIYAEWI